MNKKIKIAVVFLVTVVLTACLSLAVSATYYEPDGTSSVEYEYDSSECNRTLIVNCVDESGTLIKKVTYHTKRGVDELISLSLYGYDIVAFNSTQGLWETCKITWASGTGTCTTAYVQVRYYFRTALSASTMTATVTVRKSEPIQLVVRHYVQNRDQTNLNYKYYTLDSSTTQTVNYYDYISTSSKYVTGHHLKDGYVSSLSGNLSYTWVGQYQNTPSSPRTYSYNYVNTPLSKKMEEWSSYSESKQGKMDYCINRVYNIDYYYDLNEYTVSFNANGGTGAPDAINKYYGLDTTIPTTVPTRTGYTFKGWGTSSSTTYANYQAGSKYMSNTTRTLYAIWESNAPATYTVTYNSNGGSGAPTSQTKTNGITLTLSSVSPTRTGYTFAGWGTSSSSTSVAYAPGASYTANTGIALYAVWNKIPLQYTVNFDANSGSGAPIAQTKTENVGLTLSSVTPTRSGYTFKGWSTNSSATNPTYYPRGTYSQNASVILYAVWERVIIPPETYTISYNANGGSGAPTSQVKTQNVTLTLSSVTPIRTNHDFLGWSTSNTATSPSYYEGSSFTVNSNTILYAVWRYIPPVYTISYSSNGGSGAPSSQTKTDGAFLTLSSTVPTRKGYDFLGWNPDSTATVATYKPGAIYSDNASTTLYAVWQKTNYEFSISQMTFSENEVFRNGTVTVKVRTDSWDKINSYNGIPVHLYFDNMLIGTQTVDFSPYGVAYVTFTVRVGDTKGTHSIEAVINRDTRSNETNPNNNTVTGNITVKDYEYEMSVEQIGVNDNYCEGMTVITSFFVNNDSDSDILPTHNNTIAFTAYYMNGNEKVVVSSQTWNQLVIPSGGTNLVYFKWVVPSGTAGKTVYCECTTNVTETLNEANRANNTATYTKVISTLTWSQTPDTRYEEQAPSSYYQTTVPPEQTKSLTWTQWVYENGVFVLKKYGIQISDVAPIVTPGNNCTTAEKTGDKWFMKSGYGFLLTYKPTISAVNGYELPNNNAYTGVQRVSAFFPEYRYLTVTGEYRTLQYVDGAFRFVANPNADESERVHFIPLYVLDGDYVVSLTVTQFWTPAGMITAVRNANTIIVNGSIYDDYYVGT